jgi:ATP-dependent DNA helicase DinG
VEPYPDPELGARASREGTITRALARAPLPSARECEALVEGIGSFAVIDLETTGLDPSRASVIELGAVVLRRDEPPEILHTLVDPREPLPLFIRRLTGLTDADLAGAPSWNAASHRLAECVSGLAVVAHNAAFEHAFLAGLLPPGTAFLDTLELACVVRPELPGHSLDALSRLLLGRSGLHRALDDALDTLAVLAALHAEIRAGGHDRLLRALADGASWAWGSMVLGAAATQSGRHCDPRVAPGASQPGREEREESGAAPVTVGPGRIDAGFVREILADEARWRRRFPGYRAREGQIELACAILDAFESDRSFAAEAGTGIGKTLAYGLVSVLRAVGHGERVVVSSANRTLQERLVREELPLIAAVLGIPEAPAMVLKGRANYASPRRMRAIAGDPAGFGFTLSTAARLYLTSATERLRSGDLLGFGGWLATREPALWAVRERIACAGDCDESRCRADPDELCPYLRRVDELRSARIVSVNHSLLLTWPARYGPIDRLIVDEAHELAGEADRSFAEELRARDLRNRLAQLAADEGSSGLTRTLVLTVGEERGRAAVRDGARRVGAAADEVGRLLAAVTAAGEAIVPQADLIEPDSPWDEAVRAIRRLAGECATLGELLAGLLGAAARSRDRDDPVVAEAAFLASWLVGVARGLLIDALEQSRPETVYAARGLARANGHDWWLRATPVETGHLIHARLLEPARTVVAVSATLGIGGDPEPSLRKLGWNRLERARRLPTLVVPSPFDFVRRSVLAFVRGDTYRRPGFAERCARSLADVASLLGGRTLALFTSRQRLFDVVVRLGPKLAGEGIAVLAHERAGGAARLIEQFVADPRAVLVGTRSLWQGVDLPGDALSCVVIDKLPFPRPDDPLTRGRALRISEAGGDAFRDLSLEPAVVAFKQMFGRLIRGESDRGFVVVLGADTSKPYLDEFVGSLPGPPRVLVAGWSEILAEMKDFFAIDGS